MNKKHPKKKKAHTIEIESIVSEGAGHIVHEIRKCESVADNRAQGTLIHSKLLRVR